MVWSVLLAVKTAIGYTFYGSCKVGQFIVTTLYTLLAYNYHFMKKLLALLTVIVEDFTIFLKDVTQGVNNMIQGVSYIGERLITGIYGVFHCLTQFVQLICTFIWTIYNSGLDGVYAFANTFKSIFIFIKQVIIMFGDGVWFIIIYIPKLIISLGPLTFNYLKSSCVQIYDMTHANIKHFCSLVLESLLDCYNFLTDVPVESVIGIIIAICFMYIFLQFYTIIFNYIKNRLYSLLHRLKLKYNHLKSTLNGMLSQSNRQTVSRPIYDCKPATSTNSNIESFCIICQENEKCILVLPCKHLCLCSDCIPRLMRYTGRCPICRKRIDSTMKVFT